MEKGRKKGREERGKVKNDKGEVGKKERDGKVRPKE